MQKLDNMAVTENIEILNKILGHYAPYNHTFTKFSNTSNFTSPIATFVDGYDLSVMYAFQNSPQATKLHLYPLSHFKGMIIGNMKSLLDCNHEQVMEFVNLLDGSPIDSMSLGLFNKILAKGVDYADLIGIDRAIDINEAIHF